MENNQNSNRGVFPGNPVPTQGTIQPVHTVQGEQKKTAAPAAPAPAPSLSHHENSSTEESNTFFRIETKNADGQVSGIIEVDLISFRERGQESRFLSVNTEGADGEGNSSKTSINIDNEADFNKFKQFISQLNWND
jgi:hypothetical protein